MILIAIICHQSDLAEKLNVIWVRSQFSGPLRAMQSPNVISGGTVLAWWDLQGKQVGDDEDLCPQLCTEHWAVCCVEQQRFVFIRISIYNNISHCDCEEDDKYSKSWKILPIWSLTGRLWCKYNISMNWRQVCKADYEWKDWTWQKINDGFRASRENTK